jgi:hypothetical protein
MKEYIKLQIEWLKLFFSEDKAPCAPSHKNLIGITLIVVFSIAYLKKTIGATEMPDIPVGWQLVVLGILGIRALQSAAETMIRGKQEKLDATKENTN